MDELKEAPNNPFDAPVPGQSLTDKPGNAAWEHPPEFTWRARSAAGRITSKFVLV